MKKKWIVTGWAYSNISTTVEAETEEEAFKLASEAGEVESEMDWRSCTWTETEEPMTPEQQDAMLAAMSLNLVCDA